MKNVFLRDRTARDINDFVGKVLRDLGQPEPPLDLSMVRELLRLDRQYYSSTEDGALREVAHRLTIAGKQVRALGRSRDCFVASRCKENTVLQPGVRRSEIATT